MREGRSSRYIELRSHVETRGVIRYTPRKYERMVHFRKIGSEV